MKNGNFSWAKLYIFKRLTEKTAWKFSRSIVFAVIIIGITIFRLPWWLCVIIILYFMCNLTFIYYDVRIRDI